MFLITYATSFFVQEVSCQHALSVSPRAKVLLEDGGIAKRFRRREGLIKETCAADEHHLKHYWMKKQFGLKKNSLKCKPTRPFEKWVTVRSGLSHYKLEVSLSAKFYFLLCSY